MGKNRLFVQVVIITAVLMTFCCSYVRAETWDDLNRKFMQLYKDGKFKEAEKVSSQSLRLAEQIYGKNHINTATSLNNLALIYKYQGRYSEAELLFKRALKIKEKAMGSNHKSVALVSNNLAGIYEIQGRFSEAENLYKKALEISIRELGKKHPIVAARLNNLAGLYCRQGNFTEAEKIYGESLDIAEKTLGAKHPFVARTLTDLAGLYYLQGNYSKAESLYNKALKILESSLGQEHPEVTVTLSNLAGLYFQQSRYTEAADLYTRVLAIRKKTLGSEHPDFAESLNNLAGVYSQQCRYSEAEPIYKWALKIREKIFGPEHPIVATTLCNLASSYEAQGNYLQAEELYNKALEIQKKILNPEHPDIANTLDYLAVLYESQGDYTGAEKLFKQAQELRRKALGENHPDFATSLDNMAGVFYHQGRYSESEPLYKNALSIREKTLGADHPLVAATLNNLSLLYYARGNYSEGEPLSKTALQIREKTLGKTHPDYATSLNNLADIYMAQKKYIQAEPLYKEALTIWKNALGEVHPDVASCLNNLAVLNDLTGNHSQAETYYKEALEIFRKSYGDDHPSVATGLNNLALLYKFQGRYSDAEPLYRKALGIREKVLGENHPFVSVSLNNLAGLLIAVGKRDEALSLMKKAMIIDDRLIRDVFKTSSEKQKFEFLDTVQGNYEAFLSLITGNLRDNSEALKCGLDAVLKRKGIVLDAVSRERLAIVNTSSSQVRELYEKSQNAASLLASLTISGPGKMKMDLYRKRLDELRTECSILEKQLVELNSEFSAKKTDQSVNSEMIANRLPSGSVLVEYVNICPVDFKAGDKDNKWGEPEYFAFILTSAKDKQEPDRTGLQLISLGKSSVINKAVQDYRQEMERARKLWENHILDEKESEKHLDEKGKIIYELVVNPVRKAVGTSKTNLYLAPDGDLNLIPFGVLKNRDNRYLIEDCNICYLSCGRDLMSFGEKITGKNETFVIADPDYDMSADNRMKIAKGLLPQNETLANKPQNNQVALRGSGDSSELSNTKWNRLPETLKEAEEIREIMKGKELKEFLGKSALEEIVKKVDSPRRLHIATHGFFLKDREQKSFVNAEMKDRNLINPGGSMKNPSSETINPLLRSGLILAGANLLGKEKIPDGCDDGILTSLEISGMNLSKTDLVVLSACETGVGQTHSGEGVFGLRRAFQLAGARTVIMSLWSVPDEQTRELMVDYYKRINEGENKGQALQKAQLERIKVLREKSGTAHPFFWGAFISVGEP